MGCTDASLVGEQAEDPNISVHGWLLDLFNILGVAAQLPYNNPARKQAQRLAPWYVPTAFF